VKRTWIAAGLLALTALTIGAWWFRPSGLSRSEKKLVAAYQSLTFTRAAWREGDPRIRARMLGDLFRMHDFVGHKTDEVLALLGPSDGRMHRSIRSLVRPAERRYR
jgi:hypothetical protein